MEVNYINSFQSRNYLDSAIKNGLKVLPFTEVFDDISSQFIKIKLKEINNSGMYPVIDQSEEFISGYTDDIPKSKAKRNVIVFGDHTKILKYVDFPFIKGADGVKVLSLRNENHNIKYFYYFLKTLNLPDLGYSRYYKILKESYIPVPNIQLQNKFVNIFDSIENLIQTRQDQIQALDDLVESTFYDSFGIYISNKDNTVGLKDITSHISSGSTPRGGSNVYLSEGIPIIRSQDVLMNKLDLTNVAYISEETHNSMRRSKLKNKDILLNITGASIGRTAVFNGEDDSANTNQHVASIRLSTKEFLPEFISYYFSTYYFQSLIKNICSGGTREALNYTQIGMFKIPNVDIEKQNLFAAFVEKIEGQKEILNRSLEELRDLFDSLMQDAFDGSMVK